MGKTMESDKLLYLWGKIKALIGNGVGYSVGDIVHSTASANPALRFGGTWTAISGYVLVGYKSGDADFGTPGATVGHKELQQHNHVQNSHNHSQNSHNHTQNPHAHKSDLLWNYPPALGGSGFIPTGNAHNITTSFNTNSVTATNNAATAVNVATTATNQNAGTGTGKNIQPSKIVYIWERTAA